MLVIQQWLEGLPRDEIATNNSLSSGAVTNIVNEWRRGLGFSTADDLRDLGDLGLYEIEYNESNVANDDSGDATTELSELP